MQTTDPRQAADQPELRWCRDAGRRLATAAVLLCALLPSVLPAQQLAAQSKPSLGQFLTLSSPVTDDAIGRVRRTALALQDEARREGREAVLIVEITPGQSQFHHIYALADFLTSPTLTGVTTVAWVPEEVSGYNVLLALACSEIVMARSAKLGDVGLGEALPGDQQAVVQELIARGRNRRVSPALAAAMIDPKSTLVQLTIESPTGERRTEDRHGGKARASTEGRQWCRSRKRSRSRAASGCSRVSRRSQRGFWSLIWQRVVAMSRHFIGWLRRVSARRPKGLRPPG
ncbi:MAG: hypothetical protein R3B90_06580 [Planctomycetaceae bacterium]